MLRTWTYITRRCSPEYASVLERVGRPLASFHILISKFLMKDLTWIKRVNPKPSPTQSARESEWAKAKVVLHCCLLVFERNRFDSGTRPQLTSWVMLLLNGRGRLVLDEASEYVKSVNPAMVHWFMLLDWYTKRSMVTSLTSPMFPQRPGRNDFVKIWGSGHWNIRWDLGTFGDSPNSLGDPEEVFSSFFQPRCSFLLDSVQTLSLNPNS
uniref:Uncharacterized protein n=1 Tax=Solanum tuberosum TaxID=4113 RepID=M1DZK4_SOLTU